jgi:hypothetical protein
LVVKPAPYTIGAIFGDETAMFQSFPLLAVSLFIYAGLDLTVTPGTVAWYDVESMTVPMMSGDQWKISGGHLFIGFSLAMLFVELLRATRNSGASIMNHALSVLVFIAAMLMFITVKGYGNSIFFLFTAMAFLDFMAGFIITTASSRRDITFGRVED